jgi:hypothetical protein
MAEEKVICDNCGNAVLKKWTFEEKSGLICEDCYMDKQEKVKACDPMAVHSAKTLREHTGQSGADGLTELQKQIYNLVQSKGQVEYDGLSKTFNISDKELETQMAVLRHCELIKGKKIDDKIFIVPF